MNMTDDKKHARTQRVFSKYIPFLYPEKKKPLLIRVKGLNIQSSSKSTKCHTLNPWHKKAVHSFGTLYKADNSDST